MALWIMLTFVAYKADPSGDTAIAVVVAGLVNAFIDAVRDRTR